MDTQKLTHTTYNPYILIEISSTDVTYFTDKKLEKATSQEQYDQIAPVGSLLVTSSRMKRSVAAGSNTVARGHEHDRNSLPPPGIPKMKRATSELNIFGGGKPPLRRQSTDEPDVVARGNRSHSPDRWSQGMPDQHPSLHIGTMNSPQTGVARPVYNPSVSHPRGVAPPVNGDQHDYHVLRTGQLHQHGEYPFPDYGGSSGSHDSFGREDDTSSENSIGSSRGRPLQNQPPPPPPVNTIPDLPGEFDRRSSSIDSSNGTNRSGPPVPPSPPAPPTPQARGGTLPKGSSGGPPPPPPPPLQILVVDHHPHHLPWERRWSSSTPTPSTTCNWWTSAATSTSALRCW